MRALEIVEHCDVDNINNIKLIRFDEQKHPSYVGAGELDNEQFSEWAKTKFPDGLADNHVLTDRVRIINQMIEGGIYMFGNMARQVIDITDRKIDLGSGSRPLAGYIGIDKNPPADIVRDIEKGLPFDNESVTAIHTSHFLEHVKDLVFVMEECHRVLVPGGEFRITVPLFPSKGAIKDPTHLRFFIPESFDYFDKDWSYRQRTDVTDAKFLVKEKKTVDYPEGYQELQVLLEK